MSFFFLHTILSNLNNYFKRPTWYYLSEEKIPRSNHFHTQINKEHLKKARGYSSQNVVLQITKKMISLNKSFPYPDKQGKPEEGRRIQRPKCCVTNNKKMISLVKSFPYPEKQGRPKEGRRIQRPKPCLQMTKK